MPDRPGLDDDPTLDEVVAIWRAGQERLDSELALIVARIRRILDGVEETTDPALVVRRLTAQAGRVSALARTAEVVAENADRVTKAWIAEGGVHRVYLAGVGVTAYPYEFAVPHREAVDAFARDFYADVLAQTRFVADDAKAWTRRVSREVTQFKLTGGRTIQQAAREFSGRMSREFRRRGVGSVVYADGSRHGFGEYGEMLIRTKSGQAYNAGTVAAGVQNGVQFFELFDGPNCGLTAHGDSPLAHGQIVRAEFVLDYPLAHPNCRRAFGARPDLSVATVNPPRVTDVPSLPFAEAIAQTTAAANRAAENRQGRRRSRRRNRRPRERTRV